MSWLDLSIGGSRDRDRDRELKESDESVRMKLSEWIRDPSIYGPMDLLDDVYVELRRRPLWQHLAVLIGAPTAWVWLGLSVPVWGWVLIFGIVGGMAVAFLPGRWIISKLVTEDDEIIVEVDAKRGDLEILKVSEDVFDELRVVDHAGRLRDRSYLHEIRVSGRKGYEVDAYLPAANVAVGSWMAGANDTDIRRHEQSVDLIKKILTIEAERGRDELIAAPEAIRQQTDEVFDQIIHKAEKKRTHADTEIGEKMADMIEQKESRIQSMLDDARIEDFGVEIQDFEESNGEADSDVKIDSSKEDIQKEAIDE